MTMSSPSDDRRRLLHAWQLALLRFAVTMEDGDGLNATAIAAELDRLGRRGSEDSLHFFRRTSSRLCAAIRGQRPDAAAILNSFCNEIDEPRLRLAFAAAVGIAPSRATPPPPRPKRDLDLFRGLPARRAVSL